MIRSRFPKKFLTTSGIIVFVIVLNMFVFHNLLDNATTYVDKYILGFFDNHLTFVATYARGVVRLPSILREEATRERELDRLRSEVAGLHRLASENELLRSRLNLVQQSAHQLVLADVFSIRDDQHSTSFMINQGTADGVLNGMAVVTAENILAGVVVMSYDHHALVFTPGHMNLSLNVKIDGTSVLARSRGQGSTALLDLVTSQEEIPAGRSVITAGIDKIPAALPVFRVADVHLESGNLFKKVVVEPLFAVRETNQVFVIVR